MPVPAALITIGYVPGAAVVDERIEMVLVVAPAAIGLGANVTVTPAGAPVWLSVRSPANPPVRAIVATLVAVVSRAWSVPVALPMVSVAPGDAAAVTVTLSVDWAVVTPVPAALIVIGIVAGATVPATATVTVLVVAPAAIVAEPNVTVTPAGAPVDVSATAPVKPPARTIVAVALPLPPTGIVTLAGATVTATVGVAAGGVGGLSLPPQALSSASVATPRRFR